MSWNRLSSDTCSYRNELAQSVGSLGWVLDSSRFENNSKCRMAHGIVGGNDVSIIKGNMVDLESDLKGVTRLSSKCPTLQYMNPCPQGSMNACQPRQVVIRGNPSNVGRVVDTQPLHLKECQMFRYTPVPVPASIRMPKC